ncbi:E3 ubiquitin-protein ligase MARCHF6 [Onthophagus taurus]|uniref:E3 ubiquitin-protein ligase MARCHF6 n=1 Tax=Onthophagus taurus TaxID=166361 RepID=UPI0039BDFD9D
MDQQDCTENICRVCRSEEVPDRPLFHPCICTGTIKFIHQECLLQWMRYSRKEYCELCGYRFSFTPIYSPDMPRRLPLRDLAIGFLTSIITAAKYWLHYTLVAVAWLGVVPLTACRIYQFVFSGNIEVIITTENIAGDIFHGCFVVTCTLFTFIGLVWLREQVLHGGGPNWLGENENVPENENIVEVLLPNNNEENLLNQENIEENEIVDNEENNENNWIPMEWDRAAEEVTWERLLGLDGSLAFLEHVFWVLSLNSLFILIFAFTPYHIGMIFLSSLNLKTANFHFEGLLTTLLGYLIIGFLLILLHYIAALFGLQKARRILGLCYVVVKVSMLSVVEIGILPLICGWWLDICSLAMFDATLKDRELSFKLAPGTSIFIHWLIGMVYVYYFASFVLLLREILRPGVLWFLRNLNDPDFSPIQEMIHLPILRHVRRLILSAIIFGSAVMLMIWVPIRVLKAFFPSFLPYTVSLSGGESQVNELSLELLLLQVILPALLEQSHTRNWLKKFVKSWCKVISWCLGLGSYLLGDENEANQDEQNRDENQQDPPGGENEPNEAENERVEVENEDDDENDEDNHPTLFMRVAYHQNEAENSQELAGNSSKQVENQEINENGVQNHQIEPNEIDEHQDQENPNLIQNPVPNQNQNPRQNNPNQAQNDFQPEVIGGGLGAVHHALLLREGRTGYQPYEKPNFFALKLLLLVTLISITLILTSLLALTIPVYLGRKIMSFWFINSLPINSSTHRQMAVVQTGVKIYELYTAACGTYFCWLIARGTSLIFGFLPQGRKEIFEKLKNWFLIGAKMFISGVILLGLIPFLFGLLLELVIIVPLRVPIYQTPVFFVWQDWALGVLYTKIACAITMMGPDWWLKTAIERVYRDGLREMQLKVVLKDLAGPVLVCFGLFLAVPYVLAYSLAPIFIVNIQIRILIARRIYPFLLLMGIGAFAVILQIRQLKRLYEHIKNDKYLVGQRLVNYNHR